MEAKRIFTVRSGVGTQCPACGQGVWSGEGDEWLDQQTNHLIDAHGWALLHVGQESALGSDGEAWQHTVAVLGEL